MALTFAEDMALYEAGIGSVEEVLAPRDMDSCQGLEQEQLDYLPDKTDRQEYSTGERILARSDAALGIYFLMTGRVSVRVKSPDTGRDVRLMSFRADEESAALLRSTDTFEEIQRDRPDIIIGLLANIAQALIDRLSFASAQVRRLEK
ncbi:MAG: hypothetical protein VW268_13255 [Rhodospirillaceae bacterium]